MRILFAGPGSNGKYGGGFFYAFHRRLINGFVRGGHFVFPFSDRDTADYALGIRAIGRHLANKRLCDIARDMKPDILLVFQSDLISSSTVEKIKAEVNGIKIGVVSIDDIGNSRPAAQFMRLLPQVDFGFATTGGEVLRSFANDTPVGFIPNPVDVSIDNQMSFENKDHVFDYFFAGHQPDVDPRWTFIETLRERLAGGPSAIRGGVFGKAQGESLSGSAYIETLGQAKVGLNLNRRDGCLYASDRMAQYLGNGLLLASARSSGFEEVFGEDEMLFFSDVDDLADGLLRVLVEDSQWRSMARAGREKAIAVMSEKVVTDFMVSMLLGEEPSKDWAFSRHVFRAGDA